VKRDTFTHRNCEHEIINIESVMLLSEIKNSLGYSLPLLSCLSIINMVDEENEKEIVDLLERGRGGRERGEGDRGRGRYSQAPEINS